MAKFRCPRCGAIFEGKTDRCPRCNVLFKFNEEDSNAPEYAYPERREEAPKQAVKEEQPAPLPEPIVEVREVVKQVPVYVDKPVAIIPEKTEENTYFDGKMLPWLGWNLLGMLITILTLCICFPIWWGWIERWRVNHTVVNGYRMRLTRGGGRLVGRWILWMLLSILTLFIFALWIPKKLQRWSTANTVLEFDKVEAPKEEAKEEAQPQPEQPK